MSTVMVRGDDDATPWVLLLVLIASIALHGLLFYWLGVLQRRAPHAKHLIAIVVPPPRAAPVERPPPPPPPPPPALRPPPATPPAARVAASPHPVTPTAAAALPVKSFGISPDESDDGPDAVAVPEGDTAAADPATAGHPHRGPVASAAAVQAPVASEGLAAAPITIAQFPRKLMDAPQMDCPAFTTGELTPPQEVRLSVVVEADGSVSSVRVTKGIGHGCDEVARQALAQARFAPAVGSDGKPMRATIGYQYDFAADTNQ